VEVAPPPKPRPKYGNTFKRDDHHYANKPDRYEETVPPEPRSTISPSSSLSSSLKENPFGFSGEPTKEEIKKMNEKAEERMRKEMECDKKKKDEDSARLEKEREAKRKADDEARLAREKEQREREEIVSRDRESDRSRGGGRRGGGTTRRARGGRTNPNDSRDYNSSWRNSTGNKPNTPPNWNNNNNTKYRKRTDEPEDAQPLPEEPGSFPPEEPQSSSSHKPESSDLPESNEKNTEEEPLLKINPRRDRYNNKGRRGGRRGGRDGREQTYEAAAPKPSEEFAPQNPDTAHLEVKGKYPNRKGQSHTTETKTPLKWAERKESITEQSTTTKPNEPSKNRGWETAPPLEKGIRSSIKAPAGGVGRGKPLTNQKNPAHNKFSLLASED